MYEQVVISAQQHSVQDVRLAVITFPVHRVMCFAPTGWPIAVSEHAAALGGGERDPLSFRIQPLLPAEVERPPRFVEIELHRAGFAGNALHGLE
jgi:hypothetical protein